MGEGEGKGRTLAAMVVATGREKRCLERAIVRICFVMVGWMGGGVRWMEWGRVLFRICIWQVREFFLDDVEYDRWIAVVVF